MSYTALLEECFLEEKYSNDTFASIAENFDSLTNFVNEDVTFGVMISLEEAESGNIKDKAAAIGKSAKKAWDNLVERLIAFGKKIAESLKRFIAKAKVVIAQGGNKAIKKIMTSENASKYTVKDLELDTVGGKKRASAIKAIYIQAIKVAREINSDMSTAASNLSKDKAWEFTDDYSSTIDTLSQNVNDSELKGTEKVSGNAKKLYQDYSASYLDIVSSNLSSVESVVKDAMKKCDVMASAIKALDKGENHSDKLTSVIKVSSQCMKISTYTLNFSMSILTIATKNAAKIALAAKDEKGWAAADKKAAKKAEKEAK